MPEAIAGAIAHSDAASREEVIARLQSAGGNLGVGQLLDSASHSTTPGPVRTETVATVRLPLHAPSAVRRRRGSRPRQLPRGRADFAHRGHERAGPPKEALFEDLSKPEAAAAAETGPPAAARPERRRGGGGAGGGHSGRRAAPGAAPPLGRRDRPPRGPRRPARTRRPRSGRHRRGGAHEAPGHPPPGARRGRALRFGRRRLPGYSGSITRGGAQPRGFGVTRSFGSSLKHLDRQHRAGLHRVGRARASDHVPDPLQDQPDGQVDSRRPTTPRSPRRTGTRSSPT